MSTLNPLQAPLNKLMKKGEELEEEPPEKEELDWWSKYYASLEEIERKVRHLFTCLNKSVKVWQGQNCIINLCFRTFPKISMWNKTE